jgi:hypothetical protein
MDKTCLITGKSGPLLAEVARECVARRRHIVVARSGQADLPELPPDTPPPVSWNRRSPLSARSLLLHARTTSDILDEAVVTYSPIRDTIPFHRSSVVSIEDRVDAEVKGYQFLLRELVGLFQTQGTGQLVLAVLDRSGPVRSPLEAATLGSFMAFGEALQEFYMTESFSFRLLYSDIAETGQYAEHIADLLDESQTRRRKRGWTPFPGRTRKRGWTPFPGRTRMLSLFGRNH